MVGNIIRSTNMAALAGVLIFATITSASNVLIEDFSSDPKLQWMSLNDPVMGGVSTGTVMVEDGVGKFKGEVKIVASLDAPGFINMECREGEVPDLSTCAGIEFVARSNTDYTGYHFTFRKAQVAGSQNRFTRGYIHAFELGKDFNSVRLNFNEFSDDYDFTNGNKIRVACAEDPKHCPSEDTLQNMGRMTFGCDGVKGMVDMEVKSISAYDCSDLIQMKADIARAEHTIAVPIAGAACFFSLVSLFFVWRMKMNEMGPAATPVSTVDTAIEMN